MKSAEFIQAAANMLAAFSNENQAPADITASGKLHQVEPDLDDHTENVGLFVPPLQAKLELLKKAVDVDSIYDEQGEDNDLSGHGADNEDDELGQLRKLSGINIAAIDEMASDEPLDV
jgi:hypothetical protein